jgi:dsDNA-specific endonuclease/ATPase MutS2
MIKTNNSSIQDILYNFLSEGDLNAKAKELETFLNDAMEKAEAKRKEQAEVVAKARAADAVVDACLDYIKNYTTIDEEEYAEIANASTGLREAFIEIVDNMVELITAINSGDSLKIMETIIKLNPKRIENKFKDSTQEDQPSYKAIFKPDVKIGDPGLAVCKCNDPSIATQALTDELLKNDGFADALTKFASMF